VGLEHESWGVAKDQGEKEEEKLIFKILVTASITAGYHQP
jgi:hypothetical protein